jgi:endogenous inhibitor of DNA gyrase (YacG/DUF329 family)
MARSYKQKCAICKTNYVMVNWKNRFPKCYDCQKVDLAKPVDDPEMKKMFDIPEEFYKENTFLRDIKLKYLHFGSLSDNQIAAFKKVVKELKGEDTE